MNRELFNLLTIAVNDNIHHLGIFNLEFNTHLI